MANIGNPIIRIAPAQNDHQARDYGGFGSPKEIVPVTPELRAGLTAQITNLRQQLTAQFDRWPDIPPVVTLGLRTEALAKSHRPTELLERVGMRPIGAKRLGELLLPARPGSLTNLELTISQANAKKIRANISTISEIRPHTTSDVLGHSLQDAEFLNVLAQWVQSGKPFLIELFKYHDSQIDQAVLQRFTQFLGQRNGAQTLSLPASNGFAQIISVPTVNDVIGLAAFPALRALTLAPEFDTIDVIPQSFAAVGPFAANALPPPPADCPVVGIIDSGVAPGDPILTPWIDGQNSYLLPPDTDYVHGSFVAGLIAGSRVLNGGSNDFPTVSARIHSVAALGNAPTTFGELLIRLQEAVRARPDIKVWNCSLGSTHPGAENAFGHFAQELDALAKELNVLFIVSSGNYTTIPLRQWPVPAGFSGADRISEPAEAVSALTVGSVAHISNCVSVGEPSPFSRRGPGPAKIPKPEIAHRGGNCSINGDFAGSGVRSLLPGSMIGESVGTSFSAPLASVIAANVWDSITRSGTQPSAELVKALLVHGAALNSPQRSADETRYYGFGIPESPTDTLFCSSDAITFVFEADLLDGAIWAKTPFPIPACLRPDPNHFRGEIVMTLVYRPPVDGAHGEEYVRANVNASFGSFDPDEDGELHHHGLVPLETPTQHSLYEEAMIDHGFKWSPVKVYRKRFPRGVLATTFRLKLELLRRAGEPPSADPQRAVVILTMRGLSPDQPVYYDGIAALNASNWVSQTVAQAVHVRV